MEHIKEIRRILSSKASELEKIKILNEKSLKKAPEGTLVLSHSHGTVQYYHKTKKDKNKGKYINKKNKKLITSLAQKEYDLLLRKEITKQEKQIQKIMRLLPKIGIENIFSNLNEERKKLVDSHIVTDEQYVEQWLDSKYEGKPIGDYRTTFITEKGEQVRSKSEKIIADKLWSLGIPYRYECPVYLEGYGTVYPDFTILKKSTREEVYIEHLGMMDDTEYCEKAILKIKDYARNGIVLGKNFFVTFETKRLPLNIFELEQMLADF